MCRQTIRSAILVAVGLVVLTAAPAAADDRDLLYTQRAAAPNILVVVSNTESMATCIPGQPLPNGLTCPSSSSYTYGAPLPNDGMGDGPNSKMGIAKTAITGIVTQFPTDFNWGLTSFSVSRANFQTSPPKRWTFQAQNDDFPASPFNTSSGTLVNFGQPVGTPASVTDGLVTYYSVPWAPGGQASWSQTPTGDPNHQPYAGVAGARPFILFNLDPGNTGSKSLNARSDAGKEIVFHITSSLYAVGEPNNGPYRIHFNDGDAFTVTETLYQCSNSGLSKGQAPSTCGVPVATSVVTYKVPSTYCQEPATATCSYPTIYGFGPQARESMGWTNYNEANTSANSSGWIAQSNTNPQPIVMIPHPYTPWTPYPGAIDGSPASKDTAQKQYTQTANPCVMRSLRPASAILDNTLTENDYYPVFNPKADPTCSTGNCTTSCDQLVDGLFQTGQFPSFASQEIVPTIFPRLGSGTGAPLVKMLTNAFNYYNGGTTVGSCNAIVDGFCAGIRPDDPFGNCRQDYMILISDSFNVPSPGFSWGAKNDPTTQLAAIKVPVFVIGFAMAPNSSGTNSCTLRSGLPGNVGQCIADYTGATSYNGTVVSRQGYYLANNADDLKNALLGILNTLNTTIRDFATATIPSVSATSEGVAYVSEFNPRNNRSVWSGHLRAYFLSPKTGLIQANAQGLPDPTKFAFGSGTTPPSGSLIWDGGTSGNDTPGVFGLLDSARSINPNNLLTSVPGPGGGWSDTTHDQATGSTVGRNVFFGLRPGDAGCGSTTYECLAQVPVGNTAPSPPSPPSTLPSWWVNVRDSQSYARVPAVVLETSNNRDQALQNSFSFVRGNRDPVVESLQVSAKFDSSHTTCASLSNDLDSPCYYGDILGDVFHSNPIIVGYPNNVRYFLSQSANTTPPGLYNDRNSSYQSYYLAYRHRRKILYAGGNDGVFHAFDIGVYNGDTSSYTDPTTGKTVQPYLNHYDLGSGREIFAYAPRAGLNKAYQLAHTDSQDWTIDGPAANDDVYIDVTRVGKTPEGIVSSDSCSSPPNCDIAGTTPAWRTVVVGIEREGGLSIASGGSGGGGSVFALDVSDPDQLAHMNESDSGGHIGVPECITANFDPSSSVNPTGCSAPFPRILWELRDDQSVSSTSGTPAEGGSGEPPTQDLGYTWSRPVLGRIKVKDLSANSNRDYFVAIFGGGYFHNGSSLAQAETAGNTGNFLYMVDIETGKIIYKRNLGVWLTGASGTNSTGNLVTGVPGEPGVVDYNADGFLDRIYVGDTQGRLFKVDISSPARFCSATGSGCATANNQISTADWNPTLLFDEYQSTIPPSGSVRQPIFGRPAVFLINTTTSGVPRLGIAFGTGDRDNMPISTDTHPNWFVVVVDDPSLSYPLFLNKGAAASDLTAASLTTNNCTASNTCLQGNGYYVTLSTGSGGAEIVNVNALVFNQAVYFNTFLRTTSPGNCNQVGQAFFYKINSSTGVSQYTSPSGNPVPNQSAGSEVASDPIVYQSTTGQLYVVSATDNTKIPVVGGGSRPRVSIKSWKEQ